jgi:hypothetical protein
MMHPNQELVGRQVWYKLIEGNMRFVQGMFQGRNLLDLRGTLKTGPATRSRGALLFRFPGAGGNHL